MSERKFKLSMLEYSKVVLSKISFDKKLFRKEYEKAFKYLNDHERSALENWVRTEWSMQPLPEQLLNQIMHHDKIRKHR